MADGFAQMAELAERDARLTGGEHSPRVSNNMVDAHRVAISSGRRRRGDKFTETANGQGYSIRKLAIALGVSQATIHGHRGKKGEPNSRPIPRARAERIAELIGWPADAAHWPAGITD